MAPLDIEDLRKLRHLAKVYKKLTEAAEESTSSDSSDMDMKPGRNSLKQKHGKKSTATYKTKGKPKLLGPSKAPRPEHHEHDETPEVILNVQHDKTSCDFQREESRQGTQEERSSITTKMEGTFDAYWEGVDVRSAIKEICRDMGLISPCRDFNHRDCRVEAHSTQLHKGE